MKSVKKHAEENDINIVFNAVYSSEYNPVERLWLFAKRSFSESCIDGASYHNQAAMRKLVFDSVLNVHPKPLKKHVDTCIRLMNG